jgi:hypothetical protein
LLRTTQLTTLNMGIGITPMKLMLVRKKESIVPLFGKRSRNYTNKNLTSKLWASPPNVNTL